MNHDPKLSAPSSRATVKFDGVQTRSELEERLSLTIQASGDGIWDWNVRTGELFWSDRFREMLGLTEQDFVPEVSSFFDRLAESDRERVNAALEAHFRDGTPFDIEYEMIATGGWKINVWARGQAAWDAEGNPVRMIGTVRDVTELHRTTRNLYEAERVAHIGHWSYDARSKALTWSPETYRIHGLDPATFTPEIATAIERYHPEDREMVRRAVETTLAEGVDGAEYDIKARIVRPDGEVRYVRALGQVHLGPDGTPSTLFGTFQDRTELFEKERQLEAAQKMQAFGQLAGGVAHDFNNLLSVVLGNLDLLNEVITDPDQRELIGAAIKATYQGRELTYSLLNFARSAPLQPVSVDCEELIAETEAMLRRTLPAKIDFRIRTSGPLWPCMVDPAYLKTCIINLVVNARDAMPEGGTLIVSAENMMVESARTLSSDLALSPGPHLVLRVIDTGTGIAPDVLPRVMEPFFTTKAVGEGSGLGLSRAKGFAEQSKGGLDIKSQIGRGTEVALYLPADDQAVRSAAGTTAAPEGRPEATRRVLLVEDRDELRMILAKQLERIGCEVIPAATGEIALLLYRLSEEPIDVVITDVMMPGPIQGNDLAHEIRQGAPDQPFIFISGFSSEMLTGSPGVRPDDPRLTKPVSFETLQQSIDEVLRQRERKAA